MIMHLDMDAFFASVEQADNPDLRGKAVIVGNGERGVASTCSYEARAFGVHSAMPLFKARQLCPEGIFVRGRMARYKEVSRTFFTILQGYSPLVEKASVDEGYLDITGTSRLFGSPVDLARTIQQDVFETLGLTCSIGVAPVKFLAKIASDWRKPRGITVVEKDRVHAFLAKVPIHKIPGIGRTSLEIFDMLGINYASEILNFSAEFWVKRLGKRGEDLYAKAQGKDPATVCVSSARKSCSAEHTLAHDTADKEVLATWLLRQSREVGKELRALGFCGRTITLKVKFADFTSITRSKTLAIPINGTACIYAQARSLLERMVLAKKVRLIGVAVSHFSEKMSGLPFLEGGKAKKLKKLDLVMDTISEKYGAGSARSAVLLELDTKEDTPG